MTWGQGLPIKYGCHRVKISVPWDKSAFQTHKNSYSCEMIIFCGHGCLLWKRNSFEWNNYICQIVESFLWRLQRAFSLVLALLSTANRFTCIYSWTFNCSCISTKSKLIQSKCCNISFCFSLEREGWGGAQIWHMWQAWTSTKMLIIFSSHFRTKECVEKNTLFCSNVPTLSFVS